MSQNDDWWRFKKEIEAMDFPILNGRLFPYAPAMCKACKEPLRVRFINWLFKGTKIMTLIEDTRAVVDALDTKIDEIKVYLDSLLEKGDGATHEELQALKDKLSGTLVKADDLDGTPVETPPSE